MHEAPFQSRPARAIQYADPAWCGKKRSTALMC